MAQPQYTSETRTCPQCGMAFTPNRPEQTYCSNACVGKAQKGRARSTRVRFVCKTCGTPFEVSAGRAKNRSSFCSRACMAAGYRSDRTIEERFWSKVDRRGPDECWEWHAHRNQAGYGRFTPTGRNQQPAHRIAWVLTHGPIPDGMFVCHHCDNPPCCNPAHLFLGAPVENTQDMIAKERSATPLGEASQFAKLTETDVQEIRRRSAHGDSYPTLARAFNVHRETIGLIVRRETWKHVP